MSSTAMRRMELLLLKSDIDNALRYLSSKHCFQIIFPDAARLPGERESQYPASKRFECRNRDECRYGDQGRNRG